MAAILFVPVICSSVQKYSNLYKILKETVEQNLCADSNALMTPRKRISNI